jgi:hypothetical protein
MTEFLLETVKHVEEVDKNGRYRHLTILKPY